ncbi:F-box only protein 3-like isoform X2 [Apostichopus japonicus]|uniref:F-box only protein 3-like isoform X2 n=1 Tax=Stichopus japonicus TaxID=307972 RepID=UPI003AB46923
MALLLCNLPDEVIADSIFSLLDYKSLARISQTCTKLRDCAYTEGNWKVLCRRYWLDTERERSQSSWRVNFMEWFRDMGQYIHVYVPIRRLWNRILPCIQEKSPVIYRTLQVPPTTEEMLNEIERRLTEPLPLEFRCSYRICNGQQLEGLSERDTQFGLLGTLSVYHYTVCEVLLSAESILAKLNETENETNVVDFTDRFVYVAGRTVNNFHRGFSKRICLKQCGDVMPGSVCLQIDEMARVAPTFLYAENFIKWLESLANWLEDRELMVDEGRISQFVHEPDCWEETEKVRVSVATALVPEFSSLIISDVKLMHAYQITMSMDDCTLPKYNCTLQKRHWEITEYNEESNQPIQEVDGPGVIGKHPTMQPAEKFTYASWTPLSTKNGYMTGWFTFRNNQEESQSQSHDCEVVGETHNVCS